MVNVCGDDLEIGQKQMILSKVKLRVYTTF